MENLARRDDDAAAAAAEAERTAQEAEAAAQLANADIEPLVETERPRIDWLKAFAVVVITIATVIIAIKTFTYREEIADWVKQSISPDVQVPMRVVPSYAAEGEGARGIAKIEVSGRATVRGEGLQNGVVRFTVEDVASQSYLGGEVVEVKDGEPFEVDLALAPDARGARSAAVTVRAAVTGVHRGKTVSGDTALNIGFPREYPRSAGWIAAAVLGVVALGMIWLLTGNIHTRKQRWLYSTMYLLVLASLALPIAASMLVAQSSYLVTMMEKAPVGLVRATTAGSREPEWLVNIGGVVTRRGEATARVEGGLAVPFYVVLLALAGAGINLVRRVPEIQEEYRSSVPLSRPFPAWLHRPPADDPLGDDEQRRRISAFRRALVQNIVYLLAAPFLAMAVYYLLQSIAAEPSRPLVVVIAFLTGLIADSLIGGIFRFAEHALKSAPADDVKTARATSNARIAQINARVREEQAKLAESIFLAQAARVREDIIEARADRTREMPSAPHFDPVAPIPEQGNP
jgi:hypothetical protein